jgi:hypothetical protein
MGRSRPVEHTENAGMRCRYRDFRRFDNLFRAAVFVPIASGFALSFGGQSMSSNPTNESRSDDQSSQESSQDTQDSLYVSVNFKNTTGFINTFTIWDSYNGNSVVFGPNGSLDDQAETGFRSLVKNGDYGKAAYQYAGQSGPPTGTPLLEDQQTYEMY